MIPSKLTIPGTHLYLALREQQLRAEARAQRAARPRLWRRWFPRKEPPVRQSSVRFSDTEIVIISSRFP